MNRCPIAPKILLLMLATFLSLLGISLSSYGKSSRNIVIIGYWAPTNEMMKDFSPYSAEVNEPEKISSSVRPSGWVGKNWHNSGYDIYAFFPTFQRAGDWEGHGRFPVDFASVYNDFMSVTLLLRPVAILGFGSGGEGSWNIETNYPNHFQKMFEEEKLPTKIRARLRFGIPSGLKTDRVFHPALPMTELQEVFEKSNDPHLKLKVTTSSFGLGGFVCGFTAYLLGWYHETHKHPQHPSHNEYAGFVHVTGTLPEARASLLLTLEATVQALKTKKENATQEETKMDTLLP